MKGQQQQQLILWIAVALIVYLLLLVHNNQQPQHVSNALVDLNDSGSDDETALVVDLNDSGSDDEDDLNDQDRMQRSIDYTVGGSSNCAVVLPEHGRVCNPQNDGIAIDAVSLDPIDYDGDNYILKDTYNCLSAESYDSMVYHKRNSGMDVKNPVNRQPIVCVGQGDELFNSLLYLKHLNLIPNNINDRRGIRAFYYHLNPRIRDTLPAIDKVRVEHILQAWARNGNSDQIRYGIDAAYPMDRLTNLTPQNLRGVYAIMYSPHADGSLLKYWDNQTTGNWNMRQLDFY